MTDDDEFDALCQSVEDVLTGETIATVFCVLSAHLEMLEQAYPEEVTHLRKGREFFNKHREDAQDGLH